MTIKTCKTAVRASTLLAAIALSGGAFAAAAVGDSYTFNTENEMGTGDLAGLSGNGTVVVDAYDYTARAGKPLSGADTKVLSIAGTVTYTNAGDSAGTSSQVDFMFKAEPTDELETPSGDDIQVALAVGETNAVGTTAPIKLWCKTTSDAANADWVTLKQSVGTGAWVRATLVLDYSETAKKCKVSLDGNPVLNVANDNSEWFYFAGTPGQQFVKSISMVGSTEIDELKVSYDANYSIPGGNATVATDGQGSNVTYDYINKYGVTVEQATNSSYTCANSGMTVADKFVAGLNPTSDTKFELQTMTPVSGQTNQMKVTFPGDGSTYEVSVTTDRNGTQSKTTFSSSATASKTVANETINEATVTLPSDGVGYIHLKATK